ncbi:hypothetical protein FB451DRAFT_1275873 [Mycena latifolia]|nr:hypothetical protein FB451DRAFT_1275873 [Mycena latifolia]
MPRDDDITEDELYIGDARPPPHSTSALHDCSICFNIKSHPVKYACGHGNCYVCIRPWLECSWQCPTCRGRMYAEPERAYATEAAIALEHPEWKDPSEVTYSWDGLRFPKPMIIPCSP